MHKVTLALLCVLFALSWGAPPALSQAVPTYSDCMRLASASNSDAYYRCMAMIERDQQQRNNDLERRLLENLDNMGRTPPRPAPAPQPVLGFFDENRMYVNGVYLDLRNTGACDQLRAMVQNGTHRRASSQPLPPGYHPLYPETVEDIALRGACRRGWFQ